MKIAILSSLYPPYNVGGTEKAVSLLAETLASKGLEIVVISLYPGKDESVEESKGVRIYRLPIDNIYLPWLNKIKPKFIPRLLWHIRDIWNWKAAKRVGAILKIERPMVLHTNSISGFSVAVWAVAKRLKIARLHTLHDYYLICTKTTLYKKGKVCRARCVDCIAMTQSKIFASGLVNAVAGVSQHILDRHLDEGCFKESTKQVIHNIQLNAPSIKSNVSEELIFGFIGRITADKGIQLLLQALGDLPNANCQLKIAGVGEEQFVEYLKNSYADDRVEWLGYMAADKFYEMVDVIVIPSVWEEPLGYTCIEALFAGKGIIASDIGGLAEIAHFASQYRLYRPGNRNELTQAIQETINNKSVWKSISFAGVEIIDIFSAHKISEEYKKLYQTINTYHQRS